MAATLETIRTKVRRLTRTPSTNQVSDADINQYINDFVLYDFPEMLRLEALRTNFVFYTQPNVDTYSTVDTPTTSPLFDFKNKYITTHLPAYINGYQVSWSQDQSGFYAAYPKIAQEKHIGTGDGVTTTFSTTLNPIPFLQNQVVISSVDAGGDKLVLVDYPVNSQVGALGPVNEPQIIPSVYGSVNYITGAISANFGGVLNPPGSSAKVYATTTPYRAARPLSILYFHDEFVLRPVPDKVYRVELVVYIQPMEFLTDSQRPELDQWWQLIAYGAAKKLFQDRQDMESVQQIEPEYKKQELYALRKTLVQQMKQRTPTMYAAQTAPTNYPAGYGPGPWPYYY